MHSFCFRDCSSHLHAILGSCDPSQTKNHCCCLLSFTCLRYQSENGSHMQRIPFVIMCMVCSTKQLQQAPLCHMNPCSQPGCARYKRHAGDDRLPHEGPLQLKLGLLGSRLSSKGTQCVAAIAATVANMISKDATSFASFANHQRRKALAWFESTSKLCSCGE